MSTGTAIEWTDDSWNVVTGCTRVSSGCNACYSARMTHRLEAMGQQKYTGLTVLNPAGDRHFNGVVKCHEDQLEIPLKWRKPRRIFVNSMSDTFHTSVPFEFIDKIFAVMALCPQHTFQVLTKRPERMAEYLSLGYLPIVEAMQAVGYNRHPNATAQGIWPPPNIWIGTSVENQKTADERIPHLDRCPAAVQFISAEPLLGAIELPESFLLPDFAEDDPRHTKKWCIVGGESGPGARPMHPAWARSLRDQCANAGVDFFMKQWGCWIPYEQDAQPPFWNGQEGRTVDGHCFPEDLSDGEPTGKWYAPELDGVVYRKSSKKSAGRLLDGRTWDEFPQ